MHKLFGEHLLEERKKLGITVLMIAKECGVSRTYVTLIENGSRLPGKKILQKISSVLNIPTVDVLNWYLEDISYTIRKSLKKS